MKYYILLYYLISYSTGIAGFVIMLFLYLKYKIPAVLYYMIWLTALTGILILSNVEYYRITIMSKYDTYGTFLTIFLYNAFFGTMFYFLPLFIHKICGRKFTLFKKIFFGSLSAVALFLFFYPYFFTGFLKTGMILLSFKSMSWIMQGTNVYILFFLLKSLRAVQIREKRLMIKFILIIFIIFIPVWILEYSWNYDFAHILRPLTVTNLFYFIWNLFSILFFGKYILAQSSQTSSGELPDPFIDKYHITPREKKIISMMAKGLLNKQIAYELGITAMTVKNHIYNIYQKTGAKSKVEMLILIDKNSLSQGTGIEEILS